MKTFRKILLSIALLIFTSPLPAAEICQALEEARNHSEFTTIRQKIFDWLSKRHPRLTKLISAPRIRDSANATAVSSVLMKNTTRGYSGDGTGRFALECVRSMRDGGKTLNLNISFVMAEKGLNFGDFPEGLNSFYAEFAAGIVEGSIGRIVMDPKIERVEINADFVQNTKLRRELSKMGFKNHWVEWVVRLVLEGDASRNMTLYLPVREES